MLRSLISILLLLPLAVSATEKVSFNRDIRPILSDKCFHCHGPDEKERKSGLRLDRREAALKGGESGEPSIVPGKPEASDVVLRVLSKDRDEVMPPPKLHKPVTAVEADLLRRWIAEGAEYQGHWAFLKPERAAPPAEESIQYSVSSVQSAAGANSSLNTEHRILNTKNPIDAFIAKKLAERGMKPSPEAPCETLIRRATL